jgi:hypothetical protein
MGPYRRAWRQANPAITARMRAQQAAYRAKPEVKARARYYEAQPEAIARRIASKVGMFIEVPNRPRPDWCECCGDFAGEVLHFDHCHNSGRFRGWCCRACNTGVGIMDNPARLRLRALYVERPFQSGPIKWVPDAK